MKAAPEVDCPKAPILNSNLVPTFYENSPAWYNCPICRQPFFLKRSTRFKDVFGKVEEGNYMSNTCTNLLILHERHLGDLYCTKCRRREYRFHETLFYVGLSTSGCNMGVRFGILRVSADKKPDGKGILPVFV